MVPIFRGIGLSMNIVNSYVNIYYNMIIAYSLYFLVLSLTTRLPWQSCDPSWSSPNCVDDYRPEVFKLVTCDNVTDSIKCDNGKCISFFTYNGSNSTCDMKNDTA